MIKKTFLLLSFFVMVLMITACSGLDRLVSGNSADVPEGATEIVMWNLFAGGDAAYMQEIVDKYNNSQDTYFINNVQQEYEEYYTKLLTSLGAGKGPDIAVSHAHTLPELVNLDVVEKLDSLAEEVGIDWSEYNKNILESTMFDNQHYAIPIDTHPHIFYINNELVGEAGLLNDDGTLKMDKTPSGYREFFNTLKNELPEGKFPFAFVTAGVDSFRHWWSYYSQLGGEHIVTEDLENPTYALDTEKAIEAAEYMLKFWYEDEVIPLNLADFYSDFQSGKAATIATGVWSTGTWENTEGLEITAMPLPNIFGEKGAWGGSHTLVIPSYEETDPVKQKGALEFMNYAADEGAIWAKAGHIPAKDTVVESEAFQEMPYREDYAQTADYINFMDRTIYARAINDIMVRNLDLIWTKEVTPEEGFQLVETEVKDLIAD
ncbi:maltose-binding periplasmic proteins/domains [Oceanobacillus picturae]|uniref:Maltose-binding periplasmic proteins/domains n=1 Tax=Oceanobacillus picturae TaxID=171693 RepID=W9BAH3_9BACI|nr:extracellular solute-binding protein [Oceanobacillus picturae]GAQ18660.1 maltose-binding periplasmic proteins/domains [Oceanobacillus picturae]CDO03470.1 Maltose-binding periplasmic proteins/domains [Oceanobacillus picturae]